MTGLFDHFLFSLGRLWRFIREEEGMVWFVAGGLFVFWCIIVGVLA